MRYDGHIFKVRVFCDALCLLNEVSDPQCFFFACLLNEVSDTQCFFFFAFLTSTTHYLVFKIEFKRTNRYFQISPAQITLHEYKPHLLFILAGLLNRLPIVDDVSFYVHVTGRLMGEYQSYKLQLHCLPQSVRCLTAPQVSNIGLHVVQADTLVVSGFSSVSFTLFVPHCDTTMFEY